MVVLALILLLLVAVVIVSAVLAGDGTATLNLVGADIVTTERTLFLTGVATTAVAGIALYLLFKGTQRAKSRRSEMHRLREAAARPDRGEADQHRDRDRDVPDRPGTSQLRRDDRGGSAGTSRPDRGRHGDDEQRHFDSLPRE